MGIFIVGNLYALTEFYVHIQEMTIILPSIYITLIKILSLFFLMKYEMRSLSVSMNGDYIEFINLK